MKAISVFALSACVGAAGAQVIDGGSFNAEYGPSIWSQTTGTSFGNSTDPGPLNSNGSEIDALYVRAVGTDFYVGVAGNLETNFNKLNLVLDFRAGGQNTLSGLPNLGNLDGLTLDTGFDADVVLSYTNGNPPQAGTGSGGFEHYLDGASVGGGGGFLGGGTLAGNTPLIGFLDGAVVSVMSNHSNTGGVNTLGNPFDSNPALVDTGIEWYIDLGTLGWDGTSAVKIAGWVNGSNNDFLSKQIIGENDPNQNHYGSPGGVNFQNVPGLQYVTFVPAPGTLVLLGAGALAARRRRA
ncbi:MAG: PEP-CTERM sorting domain-containing protein [Phycisphaerales bacterium]|nr:PEP-CTERM sorting domain-containing protein [Phycisphaerales bacterium]